MTYVEKQARDGFTLIELMIAIAILGIISYFVVPNFLGYLETGKKSTAQQTLKTLEGAITLYQAQVGKLPSRLKDLIQPPTDEKDRKKWQDGGYLGKVKEIPEDPWGNRYEYKINTDPASSQRPYELYSHGKNGKGAPKNEWISIWDE